MGMATTSRKNLCFIRGPLASRIKTNIYSVHWSHKPLPDPMPVINIEPSDVHPTPYDTDDEVSNSYMEEVTVAANTAELQVDLGASLEVDEKTVAQEQNLIDKAIKEKKAKALTNTNTAFAAAAFLRTYGQQLAMDAAQARAAITHKLMEIANCGDPRYELKALELLGKHSDIGLFTERSEITINYKDPSDLEDAIKERVKRLLNADVTDVTPIGADLDDQLGVADIPDYQTDLMDEINGVVSPPPPPSDVSETVTGETELEEQALDDKEEQPPR